MFMARPISKSAFVDFVLKDLRPRSLYFLRIKIHVRFSEYHHRIPGDKEWYYRKDTERIVELSNRDFYVSMAEEKKLGSNVPYLCYSFAHRGRGHLDLVIEERWKGRSQGVRMEIKTTEGHLIAIENSIELLWYHSS